MFAVTKPLLCRSLRLIKEPAAVTTGEILLCKACGYSAAICGLSTDMLFSSSFVPCEP
jgi:hypothetical protein